MTELSGLAITGWGCVTPLGVGAAALFDGWLAGRSALRPVRRFDTSALAVHVGGELDDAGAEPRGPRMLRQALDEALAAARLAPGTRVLVLVATTKGLLASGRQVAALAPETDPSLAARFVADELRTRHACVAAGVRTVSTACTSGLTALAVALAEMDDASPSDAPPIDAVVCAGVDLLSDFVYRGFAALAAIDPAPCRPFDVGRAGMSVAEGAAALVLEREPAARARGATVRGRLLGAALANDATHPTAPSREGAGLARAIAEALAAADTAPEALGHVHAHGTATVFNDAMEIVALRRELGGAAARVPVTAIKGAIGHTFGAAGLVEVIASLEASRAGTLPAVTGLARPEPGLDFLTAPRALAGRRFLKTGAGFGGFSAAVVAEAAADDGAPRERDVRPARRQSAKCASGHTVEISPAGWSVDGAPATWGAFADAPDPLVAAARKFLGPRNPRWTRLDRETLQGLVAAHLALENRTPPAGTVVIAERGSLAADVAYWRTAEPRGGVEASPILFAATLPSAVAGELAMTFGLRGPCVVLAGPVEPPDAPPPDAAAGSGTRLTVILRAPDDAGILRARALYHDAPHKAG